MLSYTVEISKALLLSDEKFKYLEWGLADYINDELKKLNAPHVEMQIFTPRMWEESIRQKYQTITKHEKLDGTIVYTFRLGDPDANK
jgi:hypothetical protein